MGIEKQSYPITELSAWVVDDPTKVHAIIGMTSPSGFPMQACSSRRDLMDNPAMHALAESFSRMTKCTVELKRFVLADTLMGVKVTEPE